MRSTSSSGELVAAGAPIAVVILALNGCSSGPPGHRRGLRRSPLLDWATGEGGGTLELEMALAEPVKVTVVPPAAERGCIEGDGDVLRCGSSPRRWDRRSS